METLLSVVSRIRSSFKWISSDDIISNRAIADELHSTAMLLIKRETDKRKLFNSDNLFTSIDCLNMIEVPLSECCSYVSECTISRSKEKIPRIAENIYGPLVKGVYPVNNKVRFNFAEPERYANLLTLYKGNVNKNFYWIHNDYLYMTNPNIELVKLVAFFEEDVYQNVYGCNTIKECPDNPMDLEFKCPGYLLDSVLKMVRETMLKTYKDSIEDKTEDDNDTSK